MDDFFIDDISEHYQKKPKVNGKAKGNRAELALCKLLTKHFGEEFSRSLGSGGRWSQVGNMPEHAKKTLTGDVCIPQKFFYTIESKNGYEDEINLTNACDGAIPRLDEFIKQVVRDADYSGRKPIICWKRNHKPWLAIIKKIDFANEIDYYVNYREWRIVNLEELLRITDRKFWFADDASN